MSIFIEEFSFGNLKKDESDTSQNKTGMLSSNINYVVYLNGWMAWLVGWLLIVVVVVVVIIIMTS